MQNKPEPPKLREIKEDNSNLILGAAAAFVVATIVCLIFQG